MLTYNDLEIERELMIDKVKRKYLSLARENYKLQPLDLEIIEQIAESNLILKNIY